MTLVACCQMGPVLGETAANRGIALGAVRAAAAAGAEVVVLPELAATGYAFADAVEARAAAEAVDGPTVSSWVKVSRELGVIIVAGFCELDESGLVRNSAVLIEDGDVRALYRKAHLWDAERHIFAAGNEPPAVVETSVGRIGVMVCYDLEFPEWVRVAAQDGTQLLCVPTNWPASAHPDGERPGEVIRAQAAAGANRIFIAACDRVGPERGIEWLGASVIVDPDGFPIAGPASPDSTTLVARCDLSLADVKAVGAMSDVLADRRVDLYRSYLD